MRSGPGAPGSLDTSLPYAERDRLREAERVAQRYMVGYGDQHGGGWVVVEVATKRVVFQSHSKSEVIAEAQRRNGFDPVDGDEGTYGRQVDGQQYPPLLALSSSGASTRPLVGTPIRGAIKAGSAHNRRRRPAPGKRRVRGGYPEKVDADQVGRRQARHGQGR
jgi:hypothetical protein